MSLYGLLVFVLVYALAVASPRSARWVQRTTGAVMAGAAIAVATR